MQKRQKGQNITKPIVSKPSPGFGNLQNETRLQNQNYKTKRYKIKIIYDFNLLEIGKNWH
jgi:hypothetical protein